MANITDYKGLYGSAKINIFTYESLSTRNYTSIIESELLGIGGVKTIIPYKFYGCESELFSVDTNGNGLISGGTYINSVENIFENNVYLYNRDKLIEQQETKNGKFSFKYLNDKLLYDIKATPTNEDFNPRIVSNVKPVIDDSCFKFEIYSNYNFEQYQHIYNRIPVYVYDAKSNNLKYGLDDAPIGVSINENTGLIELIGKSAGFFEFFVRVTDNDLALTKSLPIRVNFTPTIKRVLFLTENIFDSYSGDVWYSSGDIETSGIGTFFYNNAHIYNNTPLKFDKDFSLSFEFVKTNIRYGEDNPTIISMNDVSSGKNSYINIRNIDSKIVYCVNSGIEISSTTQILEHKNYRVDIIRLGNTVSMYINGIIDSTNDLSADDISLYDKNIVAPIMIGDDSTSEGQGSFGGVIKNINYHYNYVVEPEKNYKSVIDFNIIPSPSGVSSYGELPISMSSDYVDGKFIFNDISKIITYNGDKVKSLLIQEFVVDITFLLYDLSNRSTLFTALNGGDAAYGYGFYAEYNGFRFNSVNAGWLLIPFNLEIDVEYKLKITRINNNLYFMLNGNNIDTLYDSGFNQNRDIKTFSLGGISSFPNDHNDYLRGYISEFRITQNVF